MLLYFISYFYLSIFPKNVYRPLQYKHSILPPRVSAQFYAYSIFILLYFMYEEVGEESYKFVYAQYMALVFTLPYGRWH